MKNCCGAGSMLKGAQIVLAGNPNVGKSALINQLTGIGAAVSNYPGTTVEILEGESDFGGKKLRIADLPGTYSLAGGSEDETVATDYVKSAKPKVIINVVDATKLERNLFLTLQLLGPNVPVVVALNFHEEAESAGRKVDAPRLSKLLGVPVVPINALNGNGISRLKGNCLALLAEGKKPKYRKFAARGDEKLHSTAASIAAKAIIETNAGGENARKTSDALDRLTTSPFSGAVILVAVFAILFASLFVVGGELSKIIGALFESFAAPPLNYALSQVPNAIAREILKYMFVDGINAGLQIAIPFVLVFYAVIAVMEDSGYLPRMAYFLEKTMHKFGLNGKAVIPMMLGFGCSVPAIISTRVLPNSRERLLTSILITLIPCSARTAVILGAAGIFAGWQYALLIYAFILALILAAGFVLGKTLPGKRMGLIMEMPPYRIPDAKNVFMKTWVRVKDFALVAFPLVFVGSGILGGLKAAGLLEPLLAPLQPVIGGWLMLPTATGITLVFGILRKELALEMLVVLGGSANLLNFMTPLQVFTFSLVAAIYIPCISTVGVLNREFGWKKSLLISASSITLAVLIGGMAARIMPMLGLLT
ncbi:MAG: ferrous iron transporter B [Candidatus Micrarchaeia archaeon]|jgi:ferrous iron transport protein B